MCKGIGFFTVTYRNLLRHEQYTLNDKMQCCSPIFPHLGVNDFDLGCVGGGPNWPYSLFIAISHWGIHD